MRIAILACLNANDVCTGAGCLSAFNERKGGFACYGEEKLQLAAFLRCSTCGKKLEEDPGMQEKLDRLVSIGTEAVHIGVCAQKKGKPCPYMEEKANWLMQHGISVIWKTHDSH
jgi:predicted metal-binding protein